MKNFAVTAKAFSGVKHWPKIPNVLYRYAAEPLLNMSDFFDYKVKRNL